MTPIEYPWRWLADAVGSSFGLRYPWADEARRAATRAESVCILFPKAAGPVDAWADWLAAEVGRDTGTSCPPAPGVFRDVTRALVDLYQLGEPFEGGRPADWARGFLAAARREMPQCNPAPVLVAGADDSCAAGLVELVAAQRALGYPFARPILLRHTAPPGWAGEVIRFGLPEPVGDLHRIVPTPEQDVSFWTRLVLALTVAWEAGATPALADDLWEWLRLGRALSLRDPGFDGWLEQQLDEFAGRHAPAADRDLPADLAFRPLAAVEDGLWQGGAVAWQGGLFDITPMRARTWVKSLNRPDAREALRRRRVENIPLARWLSAWAASVEESLRVAVLAHGSASFRRYLEAQQPRGRRGVTARSRWEELGPSGEIEAIDAADFGDLVWFVGREYPPAGRHADLAILLDQCRVARNRVVHQRRLCADDIMKISSVVDWLSERGLI
jgi:hypothetical protein